MKSERGIPPGRVGDTFASWDAERSPDMAAALRQCMAVVNDHVRCAFLAGGFGNGKTHLAIAALNVWRFDHGDTGFFWKVPDFLAWMKRMAFDNEVPLEDLLAGYSHGSALVVFDDLGAENRTDWAAEQMYRVLDARYDSKAPTIITTNTPMDQLDGRIVSRYREGLVVCKARDVR